MKLQRDNHVLGKNFDYRYRWPGVYPADLPVLNDVSCEDAALKESRFRNMVPMAFITEPDSDVGLHRNWSSAHFAARALISSLVCSLVFLMLVAVAAWIVISPGAGHAAWQ